MNHHVRSLGNGKGHRLYIETSVETKSLEERKEEFKRQYMRKEDC